tara:strand:+ start:5142 stop:5930 length:789 start_codon:yes stop_codon:yes gene_type:complete
MKIKTLKIKNIIKIGFIILIVLPIFVSSIISLYEKRNIIYKKIIKELDTKKAYKDYISEADKYWAQEILNGGYILHFRHAERDKWIDVQMYDSLESDLHDNGNDESRYAENEYFKNAVCLNERGKIQAKAMNEHIKFIGLKISHIVSSVSCRSRQTAKLAFGGYESIHRILVHSGPYNEKKEDRINKLKEFYLQLPQNQDGNVIVSSHNSVIMPEMFENGNKFSNLSLEEGGFYIISKKKNKLYLEHEFNFFKDFVKIFYER